MHRGRLAPHTATWDDVSKPHIMNNSSTPVLELHFGLGEANLIRICVTLMKLERMDDLVVRRGVRDVILRLAQNRPNR